MKIATSVKPYNKNERYIISSENKLALLEVTNNTSSYEFFPIYHGEYRSMLALR